MQFIVSYDESPDELFLHDGNEDLVDPNFTLAKGIMEDLKAGKSAVIPSCLKVQVIPSPDRRAEETKRILMAMQEPAEPKSKTFREVLAKAGVDLRSDCPFADQPAESVEDVQSLQLVDFSFSVDFAIAHSGCNGVESRIEKERDAHLTSALKLCEERFGLDSVVLYSANNPIWLGQPTVVTLKTATDKEFQAYHVPAQMWIGTKKAEGEQK